MSRKTIVVAVTLGAFVVSGSAHAQTELCGDGADNNSDGQTDEGCWPAHVTGVCEQPLSCERYGAVSPSTGQLVYHFGADLSPTVPYGPPLYFQRRYMSQYAPGYTFPSATNYKAPMGYRVVHNYLSWLTWSDSSPDYVVLHAVTGLDIKFTYSNNSGGYDYYTAQKGHFFDYLRQNTTTGLWQLRTLTGTIYVYNWSSPTGKLVAIQDGSGNSMDLTYNADGQVERVYDASDRKFLQLEYFATGTKLLRYVKLYTTNGSTETLRATVEFSYTGDKLDTITNSVLVEDLGYDSQGLLSEIKDGESTPKTVARFVYDSAGSGELLQMETPDGDVGFAHDVTCDSTAGSSYAYYHRFATQSCDTDTDCSSSEGFCGGLTGGAGETGACYKVRRCIKVNGSNPDLVEAVSAAEQDLNWGLLPCASCIATADRDWDTGSNDDIKLVGEQSADGVWTSYGRNSNGLVTKMVENDTDSNPTTVPSDARVTYFFYDANFPGLVTEVRTVSHLKMMSPSCDATTTTDCKRTITTYTSAGLVDTVQEIGFTQNASGTVVAYDFTTDHAYDSQGRVTSISGPRPSVEDDVEYTYHTTGGELKEGYLKETKRQIGATSYLVTTHDDYNYWGKPESEQDPSSNFTCTDYDDNRGFLKERRVAMNNQTSCTSSHSSDLVTRFTRDTHLRVTKVEHAEGNCTFSEYDAEGRLSKVRPRDDCNPASSGDTLEYTYALDGLETKLEYKDASNAVTYRREYVYRADRRIGKELNPVNTSNSRACAYASDGMVSSVSFIASGGSTIAKTEWTYDDLNREGTRKLYTTTSSSDDYDLDSCARRDETDSVTDPAGKATDWTWDDLGRRVKQITPDSGTTLYVYDEAGNLTTRVEADGTAEEVTHNFTHDAQKRLIGEDYGSINCGTGQGAEIQYSYDSLPSGVSCPSGATCSNVADRLAYVKTKLSCDANASDKTFDQETFYEYDDGGRVVQTFVRDDGSRTAKTAYAYTKNGQLAEIVRPSGAKTVYTLDGAGNSNEDRISAMHRLVTTPSTEIIASAAYLPFGPVKEYRQQNKKNNNLLWSRLSRNLAYRPTQLLWEEETSGTDLFKLAYTEDARGRVTVRDFTGGNSNLKDAYYTYDWLSRVTCDSAASGACPTSGTNLKSNLSYNSSGDRTQLVHRVFVAQQLGTYTTTYASSTDQVSSVSEPAGTSTTFTWDERGNRTKDDNTSHGNGRRDYTYDGRNNVLTISGKFQPSWYGPWHDYVITNAFDERNRRVFKSFVDTTANPDKEAQFFFYYDHFDRLIEIKHVPDVSDANTYSIFEFHWLDGRPIAYLQTDYPTGTVSRRYFHADEINRPLETYSWPSSGDATRAWASAVDLFGFEGTPGTSYFQPLRFPGQYADDETIVWDGADGLLQRPAVHENRHRFYDPYTGTYLQVDPKVESTWDVYTYASQDPVHLIDPDGRWDQIDGARAMMSDECRELHDELRQAQTNLRDHVARNGTVCNWLCVKQFFDHVNYILHLLRKWKDKGCGPLPLDVMALDGLLPDSWSGILREFGGVFGGELASPPRTGGSGGGDSTTGCTYGVLRDFPSHDAARGNLRP